MDGEGDTGGRTLVKPIEPIAFASVGRRRWMDGEGDTEGGRLSNR